MVPSNTFHNPAPSWVAVFPFRLPATSSFRTMGLQRALTRRNGNTATQLFSNPMSLFPTRQRPGVQGSGLPWNNFHHLAASWGSVLPFRLRANLLIGMMGLPPALTRRKGSTEPQLFSNASSLFPACPRPGAPGSGLAWNRCSSSSTGLAYGASGSAKQRAARIHYR